MSYAETLRTQSESLLSSAQQGIDKAREYADYEKASGFLFPHPLGKVGPLPLRRVVTIVSGITLAFSIFQILTAMSFPGLIVAVARFGVGVVGLIAAFQKQESTSKIFAYSQALLLTISSLLLVSAVFFAIIRIGFSVFSFVVLVISIITVGFDYFAAWVASSYYEALRRGVSVESQA